MTDRTPDDLAARLDDLEGALAELRYSLDARRRPRRPHPGDFLRFADEYAIPATIAALEANVRALERLRASIRARDHDRGREPGERLGRERPAAVALASIDRALADLEATLGGPANREATELLAEARRLNERIGERVAFEAGRGAEDAVRIEVEADHESTRVDVAGEEHPDEG